MPTITGFFQDDEGHWVAELSCQHTQHVRHRPPWESRPWVQTAAGREAHLGVELPCLLCGMPTLPQDVTEYRRTATFSADTVPKALTRSHQLKRDVWGEIVVTSGSVAYVIETTPEKAFPLNERTCGVVEPEQPHHVVVQPGAQFYVRFLRRRSPPHGDSGL